MDYYVYILFDTKTNDVFYVGKGKGFRIKYRGPSIPGVYNRPSSHCDKKYATTFAVYKR